MTQIFRFSLLVSLLFSGAIFGFFYAWVCSTIWGLNMMPAIDAIAAMQAMNASVRNAVFAPAFFGTAPVIWISALLAFATQRRSAGIVLLLAGGCYFLGGNILTMTVNVPMNLALAEVPLTISDAEATRIWGDYIGTWERYNIARTVVSGCVVLMVGAAAIWGQAQGKATAFSPRAVSA